MSKSLSRMERYGNKKKGPQEREVRANAVQTLPSRKEQYPSNKGKLTKIFYNTLIGMFILLMIGLLIWGRRFPMAE